MGYTVLKNFERGIDARRLLDCTEAGALVDAVNCHITRGGEIEKRRSFVVVATLPAGTIGFYATDGPKYHVWGDAATAPAGMPSSVSYHSIPDPDGSPLAAILSVDEFLDKLYVVARYESNKTLHWWDDAVVREYIAPPVTIEPEDPADPPIVVDPPPATVPGAKPEASITYTFVGSGSVKILGMAMLAPGAPRSSAVSIIPFTGHDSAGFPITSVGVARTGPSGNNYVNTLVSLINTYTSGTIPVVASAVGTGNTLRVVVNVASAQYNGWTLISASLNVNPTPSSEVPFAGGKDPIVGSGMLFGLYGSVNPAADPPGTPLPLVLGTYAVSHNRRMYSVDNLLLNFSTIDNPARWKSGTGTDGTIDHSTIADKHPVLVSLCDYQDGLAVFALRHVFLWNTDPDPLKFFKKQVLHNTGTSSPHSITPYSESEIMYLDRSGIRSLRSRSNIDVAYTGDLGNLIDALVLAKLATMTPQEKFERVYGTVEPYSGRLWMAVKDVIYVLSYYPDTRIAGWTWYDATEAPVNMMNATYEGIFWRSGDKIIAYGGLTHDTYDDTEAVVRVPYVDGGKNATRKAWTGIDLAIFGTWQVKAGFDATQPTALDLIANLTKSTYAQQKIAVNGDAPSMSLEMRTSYVGAARIGNAAVHFTDEDAD